MDVADLPITQLIHQFAPLPNPAFVKQRMELTQCDRLYGHNETPVPVRIENTQRDRLISFEVQERTNVHTGQDCLIVDFLDDRSRLKRWICLGERSLLEDFLNFDSRSPIALVEERPQRRGLISACNCPSVASSVACVEFSQQFAGHFGKVTIVSNKRKKSRIDRLVILPGHTMHVGHINLLFYLPPNVLEQVFPLRRTIDLLFGIKFERLYFCGCQVYFANTPID